MNARLSAAGSWIAIFFLLTQITVAQGQVAGQGQSQPVPNNLRQFDANDPRHAPAQIREQLRDENLRANEGFGPAVQGPPRQNPNAQPAPIHGPTMPGQGGLGQGGANQPGGNPNLQPIAQVPQPVLAPFRLTPEQERELDTNLIAWERQSGAIKTYKCEFTRWEYNPVFDPKEKPKDKPRAESNGEIKFQAPDKGKFQVKESRDYNPKTQKCDLKAGPEHLEYWVCDGQSIYEVNGKEKTVTERQLPPNMRGAAISDGPLPFVFGAKAASLKQKYWIREITPPNVKDELWLEAYPRVMSAAANFSKIEIILGRKDMLPVAIQTYDPSLDKNSQHRTVYQFGKHSVNGRFDTVFVDFVGPPTPPFYKKITIPADGGPQANVPQVKSNPSGANSNAGNTAGSIPPRDPRATQAQRPTGQFR